MSIFFPLHLYYKLYIPYCLVSFIQHNYFEIHPCSLFSAAQQYSIVWIYFNLFILLPIDGYLLQKAAVEVFIMNICFHFSWKTPKSEMVESCRGYMFNILRNLSNCFPKWLYYFIFPSVVYVSHTSPKVDMVSLFNFSHSIKCIVVSQCSSFNLHLLSDLCC